jgi:hypothetical protein
MAKFLAISITDDGMSIGTRFINLHAIRYAVYDLKNNCLSLRFDGDDSFSVPASATLQVLEIIRASSIPIAV